MFVMVSELKIDSIDSRANSAAALSKCTLCKHF